tara:strand:+ start:1975 stop:2205 length:231 start_codon:yes stop_codon:yes gene_type:complete
MSWNFRLVREENVVSLREVYYDDNGKPELFSTGEVRVVESIDEELLWYREKLIEALQKPVVDYPFEDRPYQLELEF